MDMWQSRLAGIVSKVEVEAKDSGSQDALQYVRSHLESDSDPSLHWIANWRRKSHELADSKGSNRKEIGVDDGRSEVKGTFDGVCVPIGNEYSQDEENGEEAGVLPELTQGIPVM